jgi:UDP-glucuronate 4-epimerase
MPTAMLRFFTVYGPRQRPDLAINLFLTKVSQGEPIRMFGDGSMSRDFTFVSDIVAGVIAAYDHIPAHGYRIWNLGNNNPVSLADMIAAVERVVGKAAILQREPMQPGDVLRTWADLTRSHAELGYQPKTSFDSGIAQHWAWLKQRLASLTHSHSSQP